MPSVNSTLQKAPTITINLANLGNTDQSVGSGNLSSLLLNTPDNVGNNPLAKGFYRSYADLFDLNDSEIITIERIVVTRSLTSANIAASSITNRIRISKALVTANSQTSTPTITQASEVQIAEITTSTANVAKLQAGPLTNVDMNAAIGLRVGDVNGLFADTVEATRAGIVIYNTAITGEKATAVLAGTLNIDIFYRKTARN